MTYYLIYFGLVFIRISERIVKLPVRDLILKAALYKQIPCRCSCLNSHVTHIALLSVIRFALRMLRHTTQSYISYLPNHQSGIQLLYFILLYLKTVLIIGYYSVTICAFLTAILSLAALLTRIIY